MATFRDETLQRLEQTIAAWKNEVAATQAGLREQVAGASSELTRLSQVLSAREVTGEALARLHHYTEALVAELRAAGREPAAPPALFPSSMGTSGESAARLQHAIDAWTREMGGGYRQLQEQIQHASRQFDTLLRLLAAEPQSGAAEKEADTWEPRYRALTVEHRKLQEQLADQEAELQSLQEGQQALRNMLAEREADLAAAREERAGSVRGLNEARKRISELEESRKRLEDQYPAEKSELERAAEEARAHSVQLQRALWEREEELNALKREGESQRKALFEAQARLKQSDEQKRALLALEQKNTGLEEALEESRQSLASTEKERRGLEEALKSAQSRVETLDQARHTAEAARQELDARLRQISEKHGAELEALTAEFAEARADIRQQLDEARRLALETGESLQQEEGRARSHAAALLESREHIDELEKTIATLREERYSAITELERREAEEAKLQNAMANLQAERRAETETLDAMRAEKLEAQQARHDATETIRQLEQKLADRDQELARLKEALSGKEAWAEKQARKLAIAETEQERLQAAWEGAEAQAGAFESELRGMMAALAATRSELDTATAALNARAQANVALTARAEKAESRGARLEADMAAIRERAQADTVAYEEALRDAKARQEAAVAEATRLREVEAIRSPKLAQLKSERDTLAKGLARLESEAAALREERDKLAQLQKVQMPGLAAIQARLLEVEDEHGRMVEQKASLEKATVEAEGRSRALAESWAEKLKEVEQTLARERVAHEEARQRTADAHRKEQARLVEQLQEEHSQLRSRWDGERVIEREALRSALDEARRQYETLEERRAVLETQAADAEQLARQQTREKENLEAAVQQLEGELAKARSEQEQLAVERESVRAQATGDMEAAIAALESQHQHKVKTLQEERDRLEGRIGALESACQALEKERDTWRVEAETFAAEAETAAEGARHLAEITQALAVCGLLEADQEALVRVAEEERAALANMLQEREADLDGARQALAATQTAHESDRSELEGLRAELWSLAGACATLDESCQELRRRDYAMSERLEEMEARRLASEEARDTALKSLAQLEETMEALRADLDRSVAEGESLQSRLIEADQQRLAWEGERGDLESRLQETAELLSEIRVELGALQLREALSHNTIANLEADLAASRAEHQSDATTLEQLRAALESFSPPAHDASTAHEVSENEAGQLAANLARLQEERATLEGDRDRLESLRADLETRCAEAEAREKAALEALEEAHKERDEIRLRLQEDKEEALKAAEERVALLEAAREEARSNHQATVDQLNEEQRALQSRLDEVRRNHTAAEAAQVETAVALERAHREGQEQASNLARLEAELEELRGEIGEQRENAARSAEEIDRLERSLAAAERSVSMAETGGAKQGERVLQLERTIAELRDEIAILEARIREAGMREKGARDDAREATSQLREAILAQDAIQQQLEVSQARKAPQSVAALLDEVAQADESASRERQQILLARAAQGEGSPLGSLLVAAGLLTEHQLDEALAEQEEGKGPLLGTLLVQKEYASEDAIAQAVALQLNLPLVAPEEEDADRAATRSVDKNLCIWHVCIPLRITGDRLVVAMANPLDTAALDALRQTSRREIAPVVATPSRIMELIEAVYGYL